MLLVGTIPNMVRYEWPTPYFVMKWAPRGLSVIRGLVPRATSPVDLVSGWLGIANFKTPATYKLPFNI